MAIFEFTYRLAPGGAENTRCNAHQGQPFLSGTYRIFSDRLTPTVSIKGGFPFGVDWEITPHHRYTPLFFELMEKLFSVEQLLIYLYIEFRSNGVVKLWQT